MTSKEWDIWDWERMFKKLTDPEIKAQARRDLERKQEQETYQLDTGL